jgi:RNA polymerase sigma-70 factor (ECF subfamily)
MWLEVCAPERALTGWPAMRLVGTGTASQPASDRPAPPAHDAALHQLYRRDLRALTTMVQRVVRSRNDAEDIVHDAFLRVWRAMERGNVRAPRAVLFKTARNLALNHLRGSRNQRVDPADAAHEPLHDAPSAEERLILEEELEACRRAFAQLPLRCRETLTLRVVDELSYKQMSERLGLSVSTLEKHFLRGRRLCRDMMHAGVKRAAPAPLLLAAE